MMTPFEVLCYVRRCGERDPIVSRDSTGELSIIRELLPAGVVLENFRDSTLQEVDYVTLHDKYQPAGGW